MATTSDSHYWGVVHAYLVSFLFNCAPTQRSGRFVLMVVARQLPDAVLSVIHMCQDAAIINCV